MGKQATIALAIALAFGLIANLAGAEDRAKKPPSDLQMVSGMRSMTATGNVKVVQNERMAIAGQAIFDNVKRTITLTENPRLWQGADVAEARTIIIYLDENRSELLGKEDGKENGEISVQINPGKQKKINENPGDEGLGSMGIGSDQPIQVTAKNLTGRNLPLCRELTFAGGVRLRQGQVTLTCDKLIVVFDEKKGGA